MKELPMPHAKNALVFPLVLTLVICVLLVVSSLAGILFGDRIYPTSALRQMLLPNDAVNLTLGVLLLLGTMIPAVRGSLLGLLCWPGALLFVLYNYIAYLIAAPFSGMFAVYLALILLSAYALAHLVGTLPVESLHERLRGGLPARFGGWVLIAFGTLFFLRAAGMMLAPAFSGGDAPADLAVLTADFLVTPAWILGGVLLVRKTAFGCALSLALLFQASMLFVSLIAFLLLSPLMTGAKLVPMDVIVIAAMGAVCAVPFILNLFAAGGKKTP